MAINASELNIILTARDREFTKSMAANQRRVERFNKKSQKGLSKTGRSFDALGLAAKRLIPILAAAAGINAIKTITAQLDEVGKKADQIGLTTDALQEYRAIAESAGVSQGGLDSSLERFSKRLGEAVNGTGAAKTALENMGISAGDLTAIPLDEAVERIADEMTKMTSPTERAAAAAALFGREGVAMVNLLREGSAGMQKMRKEARDLGIVIDEKLIRGAEDAQNKLDLMSRVISAQLSSALVELAPVLVGAAEGAAGMARTIREVIGDVIDFADALGISDLLSSVAQGLGLTTSVISDLTGGLATAAQFVRSFVDATYELESATDEVVDSMAQEINQAEVLDVALASNQKVSIALAQQKLKEALTRHENAKAAIAEARAVVEGSRAVLNANSRVKDNLNALQSTRNRIEVARANGSTAEVSRLEREADILEIVVGRNRQNGEELSAIDDRLTDHFEKTGASVEKLREAIANAKDGMVEFGDGVAVFLSTDNNDVAKKATAGLDQVKEKSDEAKKALAAVTLERARLADQEQRANEALASSLTTAAINASSFEDALKKVLIQLVEISATSFITGAINGKSSGGGSFLSSLFSGFGASAFSGGGGVSGTTISGGGIGASPPGTIPFAKGGAFTNGIVSQPTPFGFGGGKLGVMGEAGPEAVMPLMRGPGGKLGVKSSGGGSRPQSVHVTVDAGPEFDVKVEQSAASVAQSAVSASNSARDRSFTPRMMAAQSEMEKDYR